ncbi:MAG: S8 family serine peptidase [Desulfobulbaceae bacterium]
MMERRWIIWIGMVVLGGGALTASAGALHPDLQSQLGRLHPAEEISIIVTLADQQNLHQFTDRDQKMRRTKIVRALRDKADKTQKPLREFLLNKNVRKITPFWIFNGMAVTLRADQIKELAARPEVESLRLDTTLTLPEPSPATPVAPVEWNLSAVNAPVLWELGFTGSGVVIASMDTGVDVLHPDIGPKWRGGANSWYDPNGEHETTPYDADGHGTGVMGIMVGGDAGGTAIGVAPGAQWIAVKIFNDAREAEYSDIHAGFQWLLDPDGNPETDDAPDLVNNSWGISDRPGECLTDFQPDIQALKASGIGVVVAAGNSGSDDATSVSPANYPESFAAGAVDWTGTITSFSSRGPRPAGCGGGIFPEIVAPGEGVRTADVTLNGTSPEPYATVLGTSFAAPHVAGAMALLRCARPDLSIAELEVLLAASAVDLGESGPDNEYGNGLVDVAAAAHVLFAIYPLTVQITGKGRGSVTSDPPGITCPGDCAKESIAGTGVTLTAVPAAGSTFTGWSGACGGKETTCQLTMDQAQDVAAGFYSFPWSLFVPARSGNQR